ncbi:MAG: M28 family metallopeptidase [Haloarculaceae archaeon]
MPTLPSRVVGDAYTSSYHWDLLSDLVDIDNRMAGGNGEAAAAERLGEAFESLGLGGVGIDEFGIPGWWRGGSSLTVEFGRTRTFDADYRIIGLPGTPAGEPGGELVDVGYGRPADFEAVDLEGRIAMASSRTPDEYGRWIHRTEKYHFAANAGAVGFVFRNHVEGCLPPTGSVGGEDGPGPIPAVGVSKELGDRLVRYAAEGPLEASLSVDCRNEPATSRNVEGTLGPDTDEEVLLTAHLDAHDIAEGANDNGVGSVLVAEVARLLADLENEFDTRVRFLVFGAEEVGLFGAYHWVESHPHERIKAVVNVDGAGYSRNLDVHTHRFEEIGGAFEEVAEEHGIPVDVSDDVRPHSDHWPFAQEGIPAAQARSSSGESGRGWGHTHADTLDKLDRRDLRELAVPLAAGVLKLAEADRHVEGRSRETMRDATVEDGHDVGMRNVGNWPFADLDDA